MYILTFVTLQNRTMAYITNKALILCRPAFHKNIIYGPVTKITLVKTCYHFTNRTNIKAEEYFKRKDNISNDYKLIYREEKNFNLCISFAYHVGWIGIIASLISAVYVILRDPPKEEEILIGVWKEPYKLVSDPVKIIGSCCGLIVGGIILYVSRMFPFRIYHNHKEKLYKAVFASIIGTRKIVTFGEGTAVQKYKHQFFKDLFDVNGHTVVLDEYSFPVPFIREQMIRKSK